MPLIFHPSERFKDWHPEHATVEPFQLENAGRGSITLLHSPHGLVVERAYHHGGLRRKLFPRLFWRVFRHKHEFVFSQRAYTRNVQTAEPVGYAEEPVVPPFIFRFYYYSRFEAHALPLPQAPLHEIANGRVAKQMAEQLYNMKQAKILHIDLNLNNWLWQAPQQRLLVIDFDGAQSYMGGSRGILIQSLKRMLRSARKLGLQKHRFTLLRYACTICRQFDYDPRLIITKLPNLDAPISRFERIRWKLVGGHQKIG